MVFAGLVALVGAWLTVMGALPQAITTCTIGAFDTSTSGEVAPDECTYAKGGPTFFVLWMGLALVIAAALGALAARRLSRA